MDVKQRLIEIAEGVYVEQDTLRIAEKIQEYDENLRLKYCADSDSLSDAPYILVEICPDGLERIVFEIWELDDRVIEKLYAADTRYQDIDAMITGKNEAAKANQERRYKELKDETNEIAMSILKSPKDTYNLTSPTTGNKLRISATEPVKILKEAE
jgi:hypothetical protein